MGKKSKKRSWLERNKLTALAFVGGGLLVAFGMGWLDRLVDKFVAGIGYEFSNVKVKLANFTRIRLTASMKVINTNPVGGKVNSFQGMLSYGRTNPILPINVGPFDLPANGEATATVIAEVDLTQLAGNVVTIVRQIIEGTYKKLWIVGTLSTTFAAVPVESEVTIFQE